MPLECLDKPIHRPTGIFTSPPLKHLGICAINSTNVEGIGLIVYTHILTVFLVDSLTLPRVCDKAVGWKNLL